MADKDDLKAQAESGIAPARGFEPHAGTRWDGGFNPGG